MISRVFKRRNLALLALFVLLVGAIYGFAASNTVPASKAGDGEGGVSGYTVTNVKYNLGTDPSTISSVEFDLDAAATTVKIQLDDDEDSDWYNCSVSTTNHATCSVGGAVTVLAVDNLRVVAVQ